MPEPGRDETVRVVALDKNFHMKCYKCEVSRPSWSFRGHFEPWKNQGTSQWEGRAGALACLCAHVYVWAGLGVSEVRAARSSQNGVGIAWDRLQTCSGMAGGGLPGNCLFLPFLQERPGEEQGR